MSSTATELQTWSHTPTTSAHLHAEPVSEQPPTQTSAHPENEIIVQQLAPADGGPAAWGLLAAAFIFEALLWGIYPSLKLTLYTNSPPRFPNLLRRVPKLLLHPPPIRQQLKNSPNWHHSPRLLLPRGAALRRSHKAFPQVSAAANLARLATLHLGSCSWFFQHYDFGTYFDAGGDIWNWIRDVDVSDY